MPIRPTFMRFYFEFFVLFFTILGNCDIIPLSFRSVSDPEGGSSGIRRELQGESESARQRSRCVQCLERGSGRSHKRHRRRGADGDGPSGEGRGGMYPLWMQETKRSSQAEVSKGEGEAFCFFAKRWTKLRLEIK